MEVEPPQAAAAAVAAALLKCRGDGGGGEARLEVCGKAVSRSPSREAQEPDGTPGTGRRRGEEDEEEPLRRGLAAARARRKAGHATPSPSWKLEPSPPRPVEEAASASAEADAGAGRRGALAASARQLGATLWEIQDVIRVGGAGRRIRRRGQRAPAVDEASADADRPRSSGGFGAHVAASVMEHDKLHEERCPSRQPLSPASYTSSVRATAVNLVRPTRSLDCNARFRQAGNDLKTSTELLKVLNRIWSLEEQHAADVSAMKGLKRELHHAQACIQELMQERQRYHHEIDSLARQVTEDKMARRNKDQEKIKAALRSLQEELEDERRLRKHSETLHRKLGKELSEMKSAFCKAVKALEKEKKTTSLLEDLCDEFAKGIRNYEEEVRMLKQKHVKEYEHKFDKSVVHISEAWLDERMQMQNIAVKEDLAHETTITERLSSEIQAFLLSKRAGSSKNNEKLMNDSTRLRRQSLESVHLNGATSAPQLAEDDDDDSVASDLHCFELNMHEHTGPRRNGTGGMDVPKRRSEHPHGLAAEGSRMSSVPVYSQKDIAGSSSSKLQHASKIPEFNSQSNARITPAEEHNGTTSAQITRGSHNGSSKNNPDARHVDCLGQESFDHFSRTSLFCEGTTSGDLGNLGSPARQPKNQSTSLDPEILECSPEQPVGEMENTLKAKLLQARLEGRHARLKASGGCGSSSSRRK